MDDKNQENAASNNQPAVSPDEPVPPSSPTPVQPTIVVPTSPTVPSEPSASPTVEQPAITTAPMPTAPATDNAITSSSTIGTAASSDLPPVSTNSPKRGAGKKLLLVVLLVALLLLLGGGYVFGIYLPNQPSNVYSKSLSNSGKAVDKLIAYSSTQSAANYKSYGATGNFKFTTSGVSADGTLTAKFSKQGVGEATLSADIVGEKLTANFRSVKSSSTYPDLYIQVTGVKSLLDAQGLSSYDALDGQWLAVDHTLFDSLASAATQTTGAAVSSTATPTMAQVTDTANQLNAVNKQYIFTTDSSKAVLTKQKFIGKETKAGQPVDHYKVGYDKAHLTGYVNALKTALDASPANDVEKKSNGGKNLSQVLNFDNLTKRIASAKSDYTFDLWANTKTKLVQSVQFTDQKDTASSFTLSQNYDGGTKYPFVVGITAKDTKGTFGITVDTKTNVLTFSLDGSSTGATAGNAHAGFTLTPSSADVTETAPTGAQPVATILSQFGL